MWVIKTPVDKIRQYHVPHSLGFEMAEEMTGFPWKLPIRQAQVLRTEVLIAAGKHTRLSPPSALPGSYQGQQHRVYFMFPWLEMQSSVT